MLADGGLVDEACLFVLHHFAALGRKPGDVAADHSTIDAHPSGVGSDEPFPVHVPQHDRRKPQRRRTDEERAVSVASRTQTAMSVFARKILGRPIGQYAWRELPALYRELVERAIRVSEADVRDAALVKKIMNFTTPADMSALVCDVLNEERFAAFDLESESEAAPTLTATQDAAQIMLAKQIEHHAA
jgi:hypothetical protein